MSSLSPVVWSEGMHLSQHHFQAQNRYFRESLHFAFGSLWGDIFGVSACELSTEALENGQIVLVHARGLFEDGLPFDMPENDPLPAPRDLASEFAPTRNRLTVYLSVPKAKSGGRNFAVESRETEDVQFVAEQLTLHDETTGRDPKPINVGRKNIAVSFETELEAPSLRLPIARIMRSGSGRFMADPSFIPPCLDIAASPRLMNLLRDLVRLLDDRSASLALASGERPEFSLTELTRFWFLHTINAGLTPLRHIYYARRGHPKALFLEMSRLAGALCTFVLDTHPRSLPIYDPLGLDECFDKLDAHIRRHLDIVIPTNCLKIPLEPQEQYFYVGHVRDQRALDRATWVLALRSSVGEIEVINRAPSLVKICSRSFVPELVKRALPGFAMKHLSSPPSAISTRPDTQYFLINKAGPCWDHIVQTREIGVYVPGEIPSPEIEILAVIEGR
jgi:type VI secretion system protein ImpJ